MCDKPLVFWDNDGLFIGESKVDWDSLMKQKFALRKAIEITKNEKDRQLLNDLKNLIHNIQYLASESLGSDIIFGPSEIFYEHDFPVIQYPKV